MVITTRFEYTEQSRSGWKLRKQYFRRTGDTPLELSPGNTIAWSGLIETENQWGFPRNSHCPYTVYHILRSWSFIGNVYFLEKYFRPHPRDLSCHCRPDKRGLIVACKTSSFCWKDEAIHPARPFGERSPKTIVIGPTVRPNLITFHSQRPRRHHRHGVAGLDAVDM